MTLPEVDFWGLVISRPDVALLRAADWLGFGGCYGGGRAIGTKEFACGLSVFQIVGVGRSCDRGGNGDGRVGGCRTCGLEAPNGLLYLLGIVCCRVLSIVQSCSRPGTLRFQRWWFGWKQRPLTVVI